MIRTIKLTGGQVAIVDNQDFEVLSKYRWRAQPRKGGYYAARTGHVPGQRDKPACVYMHRVILGLQEMKTGKSLSPMVADHIDGNTLDNRRCNLREATRSQNNRNRTTPRGCSKYRGVRKSQGGKWQALLSLGVFLTEEEAAEAFDTAARLIHGEFARTNFGPPPSLYLRNPGSAPEQGRLISTADVTAPLPVNYVLCSHGRIGHCDKCPAFPHAKNIHLPGGCGDARCPHCPEARLAPGLGD